MKLITRWAPKHRSREAMKDFIEILDCFILMIARK